MPKSDTWPGGAAMDSAMNMDSAGSCDSVISANSACSDDSMDHLSAEERACLMYLEEMIDSVEAQEDSGLSNDEPELLIRARGEVGHLGNQSEPLCAPESHVVDSASDGGGETPLAEEVDLALIPPPSDFMDVPKTSLLSETSKSSEGPTESVEQLLLRAAEMGGHEKLDGATTLPADPSALLPPPVELVGPRSPPAVAPKPKKLPANIVLKSHKSSGSDSSLNFSPPAGSDRTMLDPQKVRMEALRKLGLLKGDEKDPSPLLSPKHSPETRKSWAAPSSPTLHTPPQMSSPPQISVPASPPTFSSHRDILPAPAAFCDPEPELPSPPLTPPVVLLTPPRAVKSATLERSGPGLTALSELRPGDLRNTRPRPASLGSKNEFLKVQGSDSQKTASKDADARRAHPTQGKLPRSQGISVLISPRAENEEDRREALRKLGLLRD
ncbi:specifically androgen-regulated gene protein [Neosynchiropus ocellatus]